MGFKWITIIELICNLKRSCAIIIFVFIVLKESQGRNLLELFVPDKPNHILVRLVSEQSTALY